MKKAVVLLLVVVLVFSAFVGCAKKSGEDTQAPKDAPAEQAAKEPITIKISTVAVPKDAHTQGLHVFKEEIEKSTDGQVLVEIYDSGSMFSQDEEFTAVSKGNADMVFLSAPWLTDYIPSLSMFTAGYIFKDYDHMTKVYNGEIGEKIFEQIADELGIRPLSAWYLGSRQINLRKDKEIKTPEDLKGVKLRMPNTPAWLFLGEALGSNPTPLAFSELYMALKTGTVDGQDNPLPTVQNAKFYEVTKSISITNHVIDTVWPTINEKTWNKFDDETKEKIYAAIEVARQACDDQTKKSEAELVEFFKSQGLSVYEADIDAFSSYVQQQYLSNKELTADWDMDLFNKIQELAK